MAEKESGEKLYDRTLRNLKRNRFPGDLDVKFKMLDPQPGENILDIGCGVGWFAATVASRYGVQVSAIDISQYAINEARKKHGNIKNVEFRVCDAALIDYEEAFDKIACFDVLEHFSYEDAQTLLGKIHKALKKEGSLILSLPLNDFGHSPPVRRVAKLFGIATFEHKTFFNMQMIEKELKQAGFSILDLSPWFYLEDQLKLRLPNSVYSIPIIGKYLVGSVNIRAVKESHPSLFSDTLEKA